MLDIKNKKQNKRNTCVVQIKNLKSVVLLNVNNRANSYNLKKIILFITASKINICISMLRNNYKEQI